jgi:hypothetical protein
VSGPRQHSKYWFRVPSGPMTIFLFFPRRLRVLKWSLLFDERGGLTTTGHAPLLGVNRTARARTHTFLLVSSVGQISASPRQHSHTWFRVSRDSRPYFTVWRFWEPSDPSIDSNSSSVVSLFSLRVCMCISAYCC